MSKPISSNPASTNVLYYLLVWLNKYLISMHYVLGSELSDGDCSKCVYRLIRESMFLSFLKVKKWAQGMMSARWWNRKPLPPLETLTQINTQISFLCEKSRKQLRGCAPQASAKPAALNIVPYTGSEQHKQEKTPNLSILPRTGVRKLDHTSNVQTFGGTYGFLSCLNLSADRNGCQVGVKWEQR